MNELDEAQGLTLQMVADYLTAAGWTRMVTATGGRWNPPGKNGRLDSWSEENLLLLVSRAAEQEGRTVQQLLRVVNPRLRKGCPSAAARAAHKGRWLAVNPDGRGFVVEFSDLARDDPGFEVYRTEPRGAPDDPFRDPGCSFNVSAFRGGLAQWSFWPVDAAGNKVRWPETKAGTLL